MFFTNTTSKQNPFALHLLEEKSNNNKIVFCRKIKGYF